MGLPGKTENRKKIAKCFFGLLQNGRPFFLAVWT